MELGGAVEILEPVENRLSLEFAPPYFWVDGERHRAARMDFEASGHVGVAFCEDCGGRHNDVIATFDRQHAAPPPPVVFDYDANSGLELFTTDLSPYAFFCTERVFRCVRENRLHNVAFIRVEDGYRGPRVKY